MKRSKPLLKERTPPLNISVEGVKGSHLLIKVAAQSVTFCDRAPISIKYHSPIIIILRSRLWLRSPAWSVTIIIIVYKCKLFTIILAVYYLVFHLFINKSILIYIIHCCNGIIKINIRIKLTIIMVT